MAVHIRRREFITLAGSTALVWPLAAHAQETRRIGVMIALPQDDPELKKWLAAFRQALDRLGWSDGRNVHLDYRFAPAGAPAQESAKELLVLRPDVILAFSTPVTTAFQRESGTIARTRLGTDLGRAKKCEALPSSAKKRALR
jgi:putative tryptophan/tyrosine transport system substrate-binding protein